MAKEDNLITPEEVNSRLTPEERSEKARKAGLASVEAKRKKKTMRETLEAVLSMQVGDGKGTDIESITKFAQLKGKNITVQEAMIIAQAQKALKGDLAALQFIRDTVGQKPTDNMNLVAEMTPLVLKDDVSESD